jgi:hypothetical protein
MVKRTVLCVCRFHRRDEGKTHHVLFIYLCVYLFIYLFAAFDACKAGSLPLELHLQSILL